MERRSQKRPSRAAAVIMMDIALLAAGLIFFALLHHALPKAGNKLAELATPPPRPTQVAAAGAVPSLTPTPDPGGTVAAEAPLEQGDFSNTFPKESTGEGALYSHQSDTLRVAVNRVQENGVTYFVVDIYIRYIELFRTAFAKDQYGGGIHESAKKIAERMNAVVATNGDYYGARSNGIVIRNGSLYRDSLYEDVCVVYLDGVMKTYAKADFDLQQAIAGGAWQAWSFGPRLMENGAARVGIKNAVERANPRCALGYYEPGHYCLMVVDGRQSGYSDGMSLDDLASLFETLGCEEAYNMDGGATAQMIFEGQRVNQPAGGGRDCSDIIYFADATGE